MITNTEDEIKRVKQAILTTKSDYLKRDYTKYLRKLEKRRKGIKSNGEK